MNITDFIAKLEVEFDDLAPGTLQADTNFREMEDWSSMHALIVIALIDTDYNVTISGSDLQASKTIQDIFDLILSKSAQ